MIFLSKMTAKNLLRNTATRRVDALDRGRGTAAVGAGQDLQQVPVGVLEVQAAAAVAVVDDLAPGPAGIGPVGQALLAEAVEGGVEFGLADQERVVLRGDRAPGLGEI